MHYDDGKKIPIERKPMDIIEIDYITRYEISHEKHLEYYNFFSSAVLLKIFKTTGLEVSIMCGFSIQNFQVAPNAVNVSMSNSRYWSTSVYRTVCFNDHAYFQLGRDIKKRVIVNGLSGSSWRFQKFNYMNLKVLKRNHPALKR